MLSDSLFLIEESNFPLSEDGSSHEEPKKKNTRGWYLFLRWLLINYSHLHKIDLFSNNLASFQPFPFSLPNSLAQHSLSKNEQNYFTNAWILKIFT